MGAAAAKVLDFKKKPAAFSDMLKQAATVKVTEVYVRYLDKPCIGSTVSVKKIGSKVYRKPREIVVTRHIVSDDDEKLYCGVCGIPVDPLTNSIYGNNEFIFMRDDIRERGLSRHGGGQYGDQISVPRKTEAHFNPAAPI